MKAAGQAAPRSSAPVPGLPLRRIPKNPRAGVPGGLRALTVSAMGKITLTGKGRRWFLGGHPWVYADDVAAGEGEPGELLPVEDPSGKTIAWGLFSAGSKIAVRIVRRSAEQPNRAFWLERVRRIVERRAERGFLEPRDACRLAHGDAEGLPGLVVDRYADVLVLQCGTQGADRMRDFLLELFCEVLPFEPAAVLDRSDASVRRLEGLDARVEVVRGELPDELVVQEGDLGYEVDLVHGHKTGAYLDQRDNRRAAARRATGQRVLDAFSYDGLFALRAALAGAREVLCLDQNGPALERLRRNAERNGVADRVRAEKTNAMHRLRDLAADGERFGLVVLDPPAFARNKRELQGAERGYRELNLRGFRCLDPGGMLVSASCSYAVRRPLFVEWLGRAALDAGRDAWLEELRGASCDHPVHLSLPESDYLKCALVRVE